MIDVDTSALGKLVFEELESAALAKWLAVRADLPKCSSTLATDAAATPWVASRRGHR